MDCLFNIEQRRRAKIGSRAAAKLWRNKPCSSKEIFLCQCGRPAQNGKETCVECERKLGLHNDMIIAEQKERTLKLLAPKIREIKEAIATSLTKKYLLREYVKKGKPAWKLAREGHHSTKTIYKTLRSYKIKIRKPGGK